jgi:uncharacterized protein YkwD
MSRAAILICIAFFVLIGGGGACQMSQESPVFPDNDASKSTPTAFEPTLPTSAAITPWVTENEPQETASTLNQTQFLENLVSVLDREDLAVITQRIFAEINVRRSDAGLQALIMLDELNWIAFSRSNDMVARGYLSHIDPEDGSVPAWDYLVAANCTGRLVEHVFATPGSKDTVVWDTLRAWFGDSSHNLNLIDPQLRYTGMGVMEDGLWWRVTLVMAEDCP